MANLEQHYAVYLKNVKKGIPYHGAQKKRLLEELEDSVENFLRENPSATMADIEEKFGTAEDIIASHLHGDPVKIHKSFSLRKRVVLLSAVAVFAFVAVIAIAKVVDYYDKQEFKNGHYLEVIENSSFPEPPPPEISGDPL